MKNNTQDYIILIIAAIVLFVGALNIDKMMVMQ
jgi:hypothetical protein